jgi:UDP-2,4-diacetamido-2,4,6-trideoxy-beta-L-altropyranose hydrolase
MRDRPKAAFRCDASEHIGGGHVVRCLTLAQALAEKGWEISLITSPDSGKTVPALKELGLKIVSPEGYAEKTDILIVDHYGLDASYEKECRKWAKCVMVIDDLANRPHDCDILLDQTLGRDPGDYRPLVPSSCQILTGADFALLRPQFAKMRDQSLTRRKMEGYPLKRIFVFISSSDPENITGKILDVLDKAPVKFTIDVVMGSGGPHLENIRGKVSRMSQDTTLHIAVKEMAGLMAQADLAIGAGGTASWERCCLGLPSLVVEAADNQRKISRELEQAGAIVFLGGDISQAMDRLADIFDNEPPLRPETLMSMVNAAALVCDGLGVARVVGAMNENWIKGTKA